MRTEREFEIGISFGNTYWKFLKFKMTEISKDAYLIFPIPEVGLKISFHLPKPPLHPNPHVHLKSDKLGIHQDVEANLLSAEFLKNTAIEWLESFRYCQPSSDEDVIVMRTEFMSDFLRKEIQGKKEKMVLHVGNIMEMMGKETFYSTKAKRLPLLIKKMRRTSPSFNLREDLSIIGLSQDRMIIPMSPNWMIEFEHRRLIEKMNNTGFKLLIDPMQRAFEEVSRINPDAFQRWLPTAGIEEYMKEIEESLNQRKPKIITF